MKLKLNCRKAGLYGAAALLALSATLPARADYPSTVLSQGPVGYWRLNETTGPSGNLVLATNSGSLGSSANGIYSNSPTRGVPGPFSGSSAVNLDGISQAIVTPWQAGLNPSGAFSVELWANPAAVPKFAYLASSVHTAGNRGGWYLAQDDGTTFAVGSAFVVRMFYGSGANFSAFLYAPVATANVWYHLVLTYDGTTASLYTNGVVAMSAAVPLGYVGNVDLPFYIGNRSDNPTFWWPGKVAEAAIYGTALSAARVSAHYTAGSGAAYGSAVSLDSPLLFDRFQEGGQPPATNSGTLGSAANGSYFYNAQPNQIGPRPASSPTPFPGFTAANTGVTFDGAGGAVRTLPLNLNTNTVTITAWIKPNGGQSASAGVFSTSGSSGAGIQFDILNPLDLAYNWNNDSLTTNWGSGITLTDNEWSFAALMVQPDQAVLYVPGHTPATNTLSHPVVAFNTPSYIGSLTGNAVFNGTLDEVAIFNRTLGLGEVYSQYASAVGGLGPVIFSDPQGTNVVVSDILRLFVDAGGTPTLSYQWRKDGIPIAGATTNPYSKPNAVLGDAGSYDVIVTNLFGNVTSGAATVTTEVGTAPVIQQGPVGRTLYPGGTLNLQVVATGGGLKYQWKRSTTNLPGATSSAYLVQSVTNGNAGSYTVSVTNTLGATTLGPAVITIVSPASNSYAGLVITSGPEAYWRLNEAPGSTKLNDAMGRHDGYYTNFNGTVPPVTLGAAGALNDDSAVSFTRNGGAGIIPYSADLNNVNYTYEAWVKTADLSTYQVPTASSDSNGGLWWAMVTGTTPQTWEPGGAGGYFDIWNGNPVPQSFSTLPVVSGVWTHLVIEYNHDSGFPWVFYVNGVTDGYTWSLPPNAINASGPFVIGGYLSDPSTLAAQFLGPVDEVAVYKRRLGGNEITAHYNAGFTPTPPIFTTSFNPQTVTTGKTVRWSTTVAGSTPMSLQWYKGSTRIVGATTNSFGITNTALSDTGTYTLWATNSAGTNSQSVSLTVIAPVSYANVTNGGVLHLKFEGNATDSSGRNNNGTAVGGPAFVTGIIGAQALQYSTTTVTNGSGNPSNVTVSAASYVTLGTPADLQFGSATSWSAGLWVKLPSGFQGGDLPFIGSGVGSMNNPGFDLGPTYGTGGWQWCLNDGVAVIAVTNNIDVGGPAGSINDGAWHHFMLTVDRTANKASSYLDGVLVAANSITGLGSVDNGSSIVIGQDPTFAYATIPSASQNDLNVWGPLQTATLDDMGVWTRALTPLEVAKIESAGRTAGRSFDTVAPPVTITVTRSGASVTLSWATGTLLQSDTLGTGAVWTQVSGAVAPSYTFVPTGSMKFYRVLVQ